MKKTTKKFDNPYGKKQNAAKKILSGILLKIIVIICAVAVIGVAAFFGGKALFRVSLERKHSRIAQELSYCSELVTVKMRYSDVVSIKKSFGFSRAYSIVRYTGIIRAGIANIADADIDIEGGRKKVTVILPKPELLGNDITSLEVFDEQQSIFVRIRTEEIFEEIETSRKKESDNFIEEGILSDAGEQAIRIVKAVLIGAGFTEAEVYIRQFL